MSIVVPRRTPIVAALFVVGALSVAPLAVSTPVQGAPIHRPAAAAGTHHVVANGSFVHRGVPFLTPRAANRMHLRGAGSYPTKGILLFEGDQANNAVAIYKVKKLKSNPPPIATISVTCPYGIAKDSTGTVYVASNCGGNTVTEYPKGSTTSSVTITNGISNPLGLAIDKNNTLYVSNYPASITEYAFGSTSPSTTITGSGLKDPFGLALDKNGNLFVADFGASQVFEIPAGTTNVMPLNLQDLSEPLGVAFDQNGNLWVTDGSGVKVNVYAPGSTTPMQTITAGYIFPYAISIDAKGTAAVSNLNGSAGQVYAYKPNTYTSYATLTNGIKLPTGLLITKL